MPADDIVDADRSFVSAKKKFIKAKSSFVKDGGNYVKAKGNIETAIGNYVNAIRNYERDNGSFNAAKRNYTMSSPNIAKDQRKFSKYFYLLVSQKYMAKPISIIVFMLQNVSLNFGKTLLQLLSVQSIVLKFNGLGNCHSKNYVSYNTANHHKYH